MSFVVFVTLLHALCLWKDLSWSSPPLRALHLKELPPSAQFGLFIGAFAFSGCERAGISGTVTSEAKEIWNWMRGKSKWALVVRGWGGAAWGQKRNIQFDAHFFLVMNGDAPHSDSDISPTLHAVPQEHVPGKSIGSADFPFLTSTFRYLDRLMIASRFYFFPFKNVTFKDVTYTAELFHLSKRYSKKMY